MPCNKAMMAKSEIKAAVTTNKKVISGLLSCSLTTAPMVVGSLMKIVIQAKASTVIEKPIHAYKNETAASTAKTRNEKNRPAPSASANSRRVVR